MLHAGPPHASNAAYAHAKRFADVMTRAYRAQHGARFVCVAPTNIYGAHDNYNLADAHVIPALAHKAVLAQRSGAPLAVAGTGRPLRQFIHSRDVARLTLLVLESYDEADPIILSTPPAAEVSIREVATLVATAAGLAPDALTFDEAKADGQFRKTASTEKLEAFLAACGAAPFEFTPIADGVREAVAWLRDNFEAARK